MSGSEGFDALIDDAVARVEAAVPAAAFKAAEHVRQVAVSRTPLESGDLRSGASTELTPGGAMVVFPGPYARYQEYEFLHHEVGQRLYLTSTMLTEKDDALAIAGQVLRDALND